MAKRKRSQADEAAPDVENGPRKTRVVDADDADNASQEDSAKLRAAKRQAKSERRSKKLPSKRHDLPEQTENLIPDQLPPTKGDQFSSDNDFVSLGDAPPTATDDEAKLKKSKSPKETSSQKASKNTQAAQQHRFILFIGNLPFSTSNDAITHHFRALQPFTVRHMTDKKTKKSRGTAFIEFESYDKMKTCLKLYHHSLFDPDAHLHADADNGPDPTPTDDQKAAKRKKKASITDDPTPPTKDTKPQWQKSKTDKTRRINVELTAGGGGGKSADRRKKIQAKNAKLADERERFQRKEAEEREKKRVEGGGERSKGTGANADTDANAGADRGNVHPSRLQRVKG